MSKHTPGPWEYLAGDGTVVHQDDPRGFREIAWNDADYRLAAAAPQLLAALRELLAHVEEDDGIDGSARVRRAAYAIAQAEGRA